MSQNRINRSAGWGLCLVAVLVAVALAAPAVAPFDPEEQLDPALARSRPPLTRLWVVELATGVDRPRLVERIEQTDSGFRIESRGRIEHIDHDGVAKVEPRRYLLGTDRLGRDVFSRIVFGTRTSLAVGLLSAAVALVLGLLVGGAAALGTPIVDGLLMRGVDGLLAFPSLLLILTLSLFFEPSTTTIILIIGCTNWMELSRLVRAELRSLKTHGFVLASHSVGSGALRIFLRHLLPNAWAPILVAVSLLIADSILIESTLAFLGLGAASDLPSWGQMIDDGRSDLVSLWWISTFPGGAIVLTVLAFHLLGDGVREVLDPRSVDGGRGLAH